MSLRRKSLIAAIALAGSSLSLVTSAGELALYGQSIDFENSPGCLTIGDVISCSAPLLNVLAGLDDQETVANGGYVFATNQGTLKNNYIVVGGGGDSGENSTIDPSPQEVEDGFKSNDTTNDEYFATGQNGTIAGNLSDPDNNDLSPTQDHTGTWDVDIEWLIQALTYSDGRHDLLIGFDYNEPQNATDETLDYWALITVKDTDGALADVNYEARDIVFNIPGDPTSGIVPYNVYTTEETFSSLPESTDFATVNGISCIDTNGSELIPILSLPAGPCPAGYEEEVKNTNASSRVEFIANPLELNQNLEAFLAAGYDTISARVLLGCFENGVGGTIGDGYLEDDGATSNCGEGGFPDIFIMAGDVREQEMPVPATLLLMGLGLLSMSGFYRRKAMA